MAMVEDIPNPEYISNKELSNLLHINAQNTLSKYDTMFFDNESTNFNGFNNENILKILIDDKIPNQHIMKYVIPQKRTWTIYANSFYLIEIPLAYEMIQLDENNKYKNNKYINALKTNSFGEKYTPVEGFTERHINIVYTWINLHKENPLYLIFDWDRTLSVCEGFDTNYKLINDIYKGKYTKNDEYKSQVYHDILEYLMGGKIRHDMLKNFFSDICEKHKNVEILVITSNPSAAESNIKRIHFFNMVKLLIPCLTQERFRCSSSSSKRIEFNKYDKKRRIEELKRIEQLNKKRRIEELNQESVYTAKKSQRKMGGRKNRTKKSKRTKRRHK